MGARQKRPQHPKAGAHFRHPFIRGPRAGKRRCINAHALARTIAKLRDYCPQLGQNFCQSARIGKPRRAAQNQLLIGQKPGHHERQHGVFRTRDSNLAA